MSYAMLYVELEVALNNFSLKGGKVLSLKAVIIVLPKKVMRIL